VPITSNLDLLSKTLLDLADHMDKVPLGIFDYVGDLTVQEMQRLAPVDKGVLKRGIKKQHVGARSVDIVSEAPYSAPVDKGHRTRQGTGRAPGYRPKPGGKSFVPANPFFSSVVGRIAGGPLIKRATEVLDGDIKLTLSKYGL
jgi:hypothetical protein